MLFSLPRILFSCFPLLQVWAQLSSPQISLSWSPKVSFVFLYSNNNNKKIWSKPGSSENTVLIGNQGRFWPACYGCFLSRTNKLLVPLPGIQLRSTRHGNQFPFNQAAFSRTLVNPLYLTSLFTLGKETYKMRAMGFCQKKEQENDPL